MSYMSCMSSMSCMSCMSCMSYMSYMSCISCMSYSTCHTCVVWSIKSYTFLHIGLFGLLGLFSGMSTGLIILQASRRVQRFGLSKKRDWSGLTWPDSDAVFKTAYALLIDMIRYVQNYSNMFGYDLFFSWPVLQSPGKHHWKLAAGRLGHLTQNFVPHIKLFKQTRPWGHGAMGLPVVKWSAMVRLLEAWLQSRPGRPQSRSGKPGRIRRRTNLSMCWINQWWTNLLFRRSHIQSTAPTRVDRAFKKSFKHCRLLSDTFTIPSKSPGRRAILSIVSWEPKSFWLDVYQLTTTHNNCHQAASICQPNSCTVPPVTSPCTNSLERPRPCWSHLGLGP